MCFENPAVVAVFNLGQEALGEGEVVGLRAGVIPIKLLIEQAADLVQFFTLVICAEGVREHGHKVFVHRGLWLRWYLKLFR